MRFIVFILLIFLSACGKDPFENILVYKDLQGLFWKLISSTGMIKKNKGGGLIL